MPFSSTAETKNISTKKSAGILSMTKDPRYGSEVYFNKGGNGCEVNQTKIGSKIILLCSVGE